jgi:hypothetical protein
MPHFSEQQWEKEMECKFSHDIVDVCRGCGWKRFPDYPPQTPASALACTLAERKARYGDFTDHARIAETINQALMSGMGWLQATPVQREALRIIANKLGRIVNGDPNYADSWHDIAGYATLAEQRCV